MRARFDGLGRRTRSAASLLLVIAVALAGVAVYAYLRGAYSTAIPVGVAAVLASVFVLLTRK